MDRTTEISLIEELYDLKNARDFYLDEDIHHSPVELYHDPAIFDQEQQNIFRALPHIIAHSSELPVAGSFQTRDLFGTPLLVTRDKAGQVQAFINVCRHRGARLESAPQGCKRAFSCPYHAWTWSLEGKLKGVPHQKQGFPELDKAGKGLVQLPVLEKMGLVWVIADPTSRVNIAKYIAPLEDDFTWFQMEEMAVAATDTKIINANWKILIEGGLEAYHFKVAHKGTIGPHFLDNLSSYQILGSHMRSVLPKNDLINLPEIPQEDWNIRQTSNIIYSAFPLNQFLLMEDNIAWISARPIAADKTELRLSTLVLAHDITDEKADHWQLNHNITVTTLTEDFVIGEAIQKGLKSGANSHLTFGRFEGALARFNQEVENWKTR